MDAIFIKVLIVRWLFIAIFSLFAVVAIFSGRHTFVFAYLYTKLLIPVHLDLVIVQLSNLLTCRCVDHNVFFEIS